MKTKAARRNQINNLFHMSDHSSIISYTQLSLGSTVTPLKILLSSSHCINFRVMNDRRCKAQLSLILAIANIFPAALSLSQNHNQVGKDL